MVAANDRGGVHPRIAGDNVEAEVKRMCETLLANTVIESYRIEVG